MVKLPLLYILHIMWQKSTLYCSHEACHLVVTFVNFFSWQWSTMVWQWSLLSFSSAGNGQQWSGNGDLSFFKLAMVNNDLVMVTFVILWNWQWLTMVWKWWPLLDKLFKMTIVRHHCLTIANHGRPWFDHGWRWYHGFIFAGAVPRGHYHSEWCAR